MSMEDMDSYLDCLDEIAKYNHIEDVEIIESDEDWSLN